MHPLSSRPLIEASVGFGSLGTHGQLGYENQTVSANGRSWPHALSPHPPSRLRFDLGRAFQSFHSLVGFNDDVRQRHTHAHFLVRADGHLVAIAPLVRPGDPHRPVTANLTGVSQLELEIVTDRWDYCHAVWLDPHVSPEPQPDPPLTLADPLHRVEISIPHPLPRAERCIATVVSPGFESYLEDFLLSLRARGNRADALLVILAVDPNERCLALARQHDALVIPCRSLGKIGVSVKSALYSIARIVDARHYLCIDADTLVLSDLEPLFHACSLAPTGRILVCPEANDPNWQRLGWALQHVYFGQAPDLRRIAPVLNGEADYPFVVNDGVFAGGKEALLALDGEMRRLPGALAWMEEKPRVCWWRNQFLFNLTLARLNSAWPLDNAFNVQLHTHDVEIRGDGPATDVRFRGVPVRILHLCGIGKNKYQPWRASLRAAWQPVP